MKYLLIVLFLFVVGCGKSYKMYELELGKIESVKVGDVYEQTWKGGVYGMAGVEIKTFTLEQTTEIEKYKVTLETHWEITIYIFTVKKGVVINIWKDRVSIYR